jgi:hypothetical protein
MENLKKAPNLVLTGLKSAPACVSMGSESHEQLRVMECGDMGEQGEQGNAAVGLWRRFSCASPHRRTQGSLKVLV